jgi:hypothetical protein
MTEVGGDLCLERQTDANAPVVEPRAAIIYPERQGPCGCARLARAPDSRYRNGSGG